MLLFPFTVILLSSLPLLISGQRTNQCQPNSIRWRKEIHDLSDAEWNRFLAALSELKRRPSILFSSRGASGSARRNNQRRDRREDGNENDDEPSRWSSSSDGWITAESENTTSVNSPPPNSNHQIAASGLLECAVDRIRNTLYGLRKVPSFEAGLLSDQLSDTYEALLESLAKIQSNSNQSLLWSTDDPRPANNTSAIPHHTTTVATQESIAVEHGNHRVAAAVDENRCKSPLFGSPETALEQSVDPRFFSLDDFSALHRIHRLRT